MDGFLLPYKGRLSPENRKVGVRGTLKIIKQEGEVPKGRRRTIIHQYIEENAKALGLPEDGFSTEFVLIFRVCAG